MNGSELFYSAAAPASPDSESMDSSSVSGGMYSSSGRDRRAVNYAVDLGCEDDDEDDDIYDPVASNNYRNEDEIAMLKSSSKDTEVAAKPKKKRKPTTTPPKKRRVHVGEKVCSSCSSTSTPIWREVKEQWGDGWDHILLCNACGLRKLFQTLCHLIIIIVEWRMAGLRCAKCLYVPRASEKREKACTRCPDGFWYRNS
jgi:hypothetical protein